MTSSISWIDRAGLAETLARFNLVANGPALRIKAPVTLPPLKLAHRPQPSLEPFEVPSGSLRERLEAFIDWLMRLERSRVAFVIDRDGLPLVDRGADADLLAIACSVMQLVERLNSKILAVVGQTVTLQFEEGLLVLISVGTPIGDYTIGHVSERLPEPATLRAMADALRAAFDSDDQRALQ